MYVGKKTITYYGVTKNIYSIVVGERNLERNYYAMIMKNKETEGIVDATYTDYGKTIEELALSLCPQIFNDNNYSANTYWITGYGLVGSIASEIAARFSDGGGEVFCYTFGAINTGKGRKGTYLNIKNVINEDDYIPKMMNKEIFTKPGQIYSSSIKEDLLREYRDIIGNTNYKGDYYLSNFISKIFEERKNGISNEMYEKLAREWSRHLEHYSNISSELQTNGETSDVAIAINNMSRATEDAHSMKSYYVLAKSLNGFDLTDGEKQQKYQYIPQSILLAFDGKQSETESSEDTLHNMKRALDDMADWYVDNVFTYQGSKAYEDFIAVDKTNGTSGHKMYMLGTGNDNRIEFYKTTDGTDVIFGGNYKYIEQENDSDTEVKKKEGNHTNKYYFKRMTSNLTEFVYDWICYIKASKEACENNHEYRKKTGSKLNYYLSDDTNPIKSYPSYNEPGDDCARFAFAVLELGTGIDAEELVSTGNDAGQFITDNLEGGTIDKMNDYFVISTGSELIRKFNEGLQDGDMLVALKGDGESSTNKNTRNHCEFINTEYNTSDGIWTGAFGWGDVKKDVKSQLKLSIVDNEYIYSSEDRTYYSALYRKREKVQ